MLGNSIFLLETRESCVRENSHRKNEGIRVKKRMRGAATQMQKSKRWIEGYSRYKEIEREKKNAGGVAWGLKQQFPSKISLIFQQLRSL